MDWITEQIAIGGIRDAAAFFKNEQKKASSSDINAILCLDPDCKNCDKQSENFNIECLPLIDGSGNDIRNLNDAVDFIDDVVSAGEKILVHCHAGRSRSVCIAARYFMMKNGMTKHDALKMIESHREIYLSPGIEEILRIKD